MNFKEHKHRGRLQGRLPHADAPFSRRVARENFRGDYKSGLIFYFPEQSGDLRNLWGVRRMDSRLRVQSGSFFHSGTIAKTALPPLS